MILKINESFRILKLNKESILTRSNASLILRPIQSFQLTVQTFKVYNSTITLAQLRSHYY